MAKQRKFLVLDTETATIPCANNIAHNADEKKKIAIAKPLVYDLGYVVVNASGKVLKKVNYLTQEIYCNEKLFQTAYYAWKRPLYEKMLQKGTLAIKSWMDILQELAADLKEVEMTCAFNACFDFKKAIPYTCDYIYHLSYKKDFEKWVRGQEWACKMLLTCGSTGENPTYLNPIFRLFKNNYPITDLWTLACEHLAENKKYKNFCLKNDRITNSAEYFSTSAESVFSYYTKDEQFNEEHTALSDAEIEAKILIRLLKAKKFYQTIKPFPFQKLGSTFNFIEHSPKYKEKIAQRLGDFIYKNNGYEKTNTGYWSRICGIYDNL